jgi:WD40 repeat protein
VKALSWHPSQSNVLASGGGSADRSLRLWDVSARRCFNFGDARAQVTGVVWSKQTHELCTSHGYADDGSVVLWTNPDLVQLTRVHQLPRQDRVL